MESLFYGPRASVLLAWPEIAREAGNLQSMRLFEAAVEHTPSQSETVKVLTKGDQRDARRLRNDCCSSGGML